MLVSKQKLRAASQANYILEGNKKDMIEQHVDTPLDQDILLSSMVI